MPETCDTNIHEVAERCVDDMGDVFWDCDTARDAALGFREPREIAIASVQRALTDVQDAVDRASLCPIVLRSEYATLVAEAGPKATDAALLRSMVKDADWTPEGAEEVLRLAREYGTSILRNALTLADALGIEDGSRGL
jgi:hypothetical protein